jgi:hypothetical protein
MNGLKSEIPDAFHKKSRSRAMLFIQLLRQISRVKLDSLEARLCPVEGKFGQKKA